MKKTLIAGAIATLLAAPVMAQNVTLDQISKELAELKAKNERLEAEVEYLKQETKGQRKDAAVEAVDVANLKTNTSRLTWSGDFRYRHEEIATDGNVTDRNRDRIRVRFGALIKVNDTINAKIQLSTTNTGGDNARSTNQTLGNGTAGNGAWDRKSVSFDQAYADWKPFSTTNVILGKMPIPWTTTASYFWDKDLTPEGGAIKFASGIWFANAGYMRLAEQDSGNNVTFGVARSVDSDLAVAQVGIKLPIGTTALTVTAGYFDLHHVQDQPVLITGTGCPTYSAPNPTFGGNAYGNSTYVVGAGGNTCTLLLSAFQMAEVLVQYDFALGRFPISVYADYMQNGGAEVNPITGTKLDTAGSAGLTFNKASAPKSWEASVIYQFSEKDGVFGQFHDSDFGGGITDTEGYGIKAAWVPAANWTLNGTYFINKRFNDAPTTNGTITIPTKDQDYNRLQLDLNYKF